MERNGPASKRRRREKSGQIRNGLHADPFLITPNQYRPASDMTVSLTKISIPPLRLQPRASPKAINIPKPLLADSRLKGCQIQSRSRYLLNNPPPQTGQQRHPSSTIPRTHACTCLSFVAAAASFSLSFFFIHFLFCYQFIFDSLVCMI